ncbi:hypothetical protein PHO31112_05020 [Pandoraea horticolens]|uniref:Uncharacterized protein n=1 Tax=Pandoraea horticolens TaxID=2508298 RepID=A0A5E4Z4P9_9BURK|nr:hypothetical protein PHO31112_05020 [Pandoraea horticolens]
MRASSSWIDWTITTPTSRANLNTRSGDREDMLIYLFAGSSGDSRREYDDSAAPVLNAISRHIFVVHP